MSNINSYFVDQTDDIIRLLIEIKDNDDERVSSFYYELKLRIIGGKLDKNYYELISVDEIFNIMDYLYKNFDGNIKKRKLDDITNQYIVRLMNFQTYKKGFNERLVKRLMVYAASLDNKIKGNN